MFIQYSLSISSQLDHEVLHGLQHFYVKLKLAIDLNIKTAKVFYFNV